VASRVGVRVSVRCDCCGAAEATNKRAWLEKNGGRNRRKISIGRPKVILRLEFLPLALFKSKTFFLRGSAISFLSGRRLTTFHVQIRKILPACGGTLANTLDLDSNSITHIISDSLCFPEWRDILSRRRLQLTDKDLRRLGWSKEPRDKFIETIDERHLEGWSCVLRSGGDWEGVQVVTVSFNAFASPVRKESYNFDRSCLSQNGSYVLSI
jgi:hypothetical protein